jgi:hypothetical protein
VLSAAPPVPDSNGSGRVDVKVTGTVQKPPPAGTTDWVFVRLYRNSHTVELYPREPFDGTQPVDLTFDTSASESAHSRCPRPGP